MLESSAHGKFAFQLKNQSYKCIRGRQTEYDLIYKAHIIL